MLLLWIELNYSQMFRTFISNYKQGARLLLQAFCCMMIFAFTMLPIGLIRFVGSPSGGAKQVDFFGLSMGDSLSLLLYIVFGPIGFCYAFKLCFRETFEGGDVQGGQGKSEGNSKRVTRRGQ